MSFLPRAPRDAAWLAFGCAVGAAIGAIVASHLRQRPSSASQGARPRVLSTPKKVVDVPGVVSITEHVGNVGNGETAVSIARVATGAGFEDPPHTPLCIFMFLPAKFTYQWRIKKFLSQRRAKRCICPEGTATA